MNREDMGDRGIGIQRGREGGDVWRGVFRRFQGSPGAPGTVRDLARPLAIGTVDQDQQFAVARHESADHGFHRKGAAALHRNGDQPVAAGDLRQALKHAPVQGDEGRIARSPIMQHRLLDGFRRGQRTGRQQQWIAGFAFGAGQGHGLSSKAGQAMRRGGSSAARFIASNPY